MMAELMTADQVRAFCIQAQEEIGEVLAELSQSEERDAMLAHLEALKSFWRGASDSFALDFANVTMRAALEGRL
jgi:hypothetical protein